MKHSSSRYDDTNMTLLT